MELRAYSRAKEYYDRTPMEKRENSPMVDLVSEIVFSLAKERMQQA